MKPDPAIEDIRRIRRQISARFKHDPRRLVEYYIELQKRHQDRLILQSQIPEETTATD